jgi:hypothetical protein
MALVAALVAMLAAPVLADHPGGATHPAQRPAVSGSTQTHVFLLAGHPARGGRIIAVTRLDAEATADQQAATHAEVRHGTRGFVFAIARLAAEGQAVGTSLVTVNGGTRAMADVAAQLRAAASGTGTLLVFADGRRREGVVTAMFAVSQLQARTRLALNGATHVTILSNSREETFAIASSGQTAATVQVAAEADGAAASVEGGVQGLLDIVIGLGL